MEVYLLVVGVFVFTGVFSCYWNGQHKIMAISYGILFNRQMAMVAKFLIHMRSPLHFFHLLHTAQELETLMFMSTADCNRSGHVAADTINTFTARKGAGARLGSA